MSAGYDYFKAQAEQNVRSLNALYDISSAAKVLNRDNVTIPELVTTLRKISVIADTALERMNEQKPQSSAPVLAPQG